MAHDPQPATTTHLVGHLLRELEPALRDVLRPMIPEQTGGSTKPMFDSGQRTNVHPDCVPDHTITDFRDLLKLLGLP